MRQERRYKIMISRTRFTGINLIAQDGKFGPMIGHFPEVK